MTLLDRLRSRPRWQHPDPILRAEAVRQIASQDQALLSEIARTDADARVRRAALRKLSDPRTLAELLASEVDVGAREEAAEALLSWAAGDDEGSAHVALAALSDPRQIAQLARSARLVSVRRAALARVDDARLLLALAKAAEDPAVRAQALARLQDSALLLEVAAKTDHKDMAMAAVDRVDDVAALEQIAERARHKAASRRARARLETLRPRPTPAAPAAESHPALEATEPVATLEPSEALQAAGEADETGTPPALDPTLAVPIEPESLTEVQALEAAAPHPVIGNSDAAPIAPEPAQLRAAADSQRQAHERARREGQTRAQSLCERLEALGARKGLTLKEAEAALREARAFQAEASALPGKLVHRLKVARTALFARAQELHEADEWSRWGNAAVQEALCAQLQALLGREDWERVARELQEADARWAEFRHAPKDQAEALRQRYQAVRAQLKARLDAYFERKAAAEAHNLEQRQALCARAEALSDSTEWLKASDELKALQARWKQIGPAPHRPSQAAWKRFRAACDRFFTRRNEDLQRRKAEWAANLGCKEALCARAEAVSQSSDWQAAADELRRVQAEWKSVGPVRKSKSEAVWQRFRAACDAFFERYKNRDALELAAKRAACDELCRELEAMLPGVGDQEGPQPADLLRKVQALQARWRQAPRLPGEEELALERRFLDTRARLVAARAEAFRGSELDPEVVRARKEKLCARVEALLGGSGAAGGAELSGEALARRLMEALAGNTIGGAGQAEARQRAESEEVEAARVAWSRLGAVPGPAGEALEQRFREACARYIRERQPTASARAARLSPRGRPSGTSRASRTP